LANEEDKDRGHSGKRQPGVTECPEQEDSEDAGGQQEHAASDRQRQFETG
jgi:hypothetical protein